MKIRAKATILLLFFAAFRQSSRAAEFPHDGLVFKQVQSHGLLLDESGKLVSVRWDAKFNPETDPSKRLDYVVNTLTIRPVKEVVDSAGNVSYVPEKRKVAYSLFTLGAQSVTHDIMIREAKAGSGDVCFAALNDTTATRRTLPFLVKRTNVVADEKAPKQEAVDGSKIWFVAFESEWCELVVEAANRKKAGKTTWAGGGSGNDHDNQPPKNPPD